MRKRSVKVKITLWYLLLMGLMAGLMLVFLRLMNSEQSVVGCIATTATEHSSVIVRIPSVWKFPHLAYGWLRFTLICSREKCLKRLLKNTRSFRMHSRKRCMYP